ncbi:hypothetical protein PARMER_01836 [Parabacteroides merdae ATCC 43184]|nr:hypothetical protein PARMER_01836 [Parabacteroides merdae ATCC 43184]
MLSGIKCTTFYPVLRTLQKRNTILLWSLPGYTFKLLDKVWNITIA